MSNIVGRQRRKERIRARIRRKSGQYPRLSVFRSNKNVYAQVIDDANGKTLAFASSLEKALKSKLKVGSNVKAAEEIGKLIAERASKAKVKEVVFDRGCYLYHGRVKALADAARANGLSF